MSADATGKRDSTGSTAILKGSEPNWCDALSHPQAAAMGWGGSETPCFVGRAVALSP